MARTSHPVPCSRRLSLVLALTLAGTCWSTPRDAAAVDATGVFSASGFLGMDTLSLRQTGSTLSLCVESGGFIGKLMEGTIDSATGAFDLSLARQVFGGGFSWCALTLTGTFAPDGSAFSASFEQHVTCVPPPFTCQPQCLLAGSGPVAGTRSSTTPAPCCGDGVPDLGEDCDDGNTSDADCCSGRCTQSPMCTTTSTTTTTTVSPSSSTTIGSTTTSTTTLPPTGCAPSPLAGCRLSGTATLKLVDRSPDGRDRVMWMWTKGGAPPDEFGDPLATTDYAFCLYEAFSFPVMSLRIPAGGMCGAKPCWKSAGAQGFAYRDRGLTPDGVAKLVLVPDPGGAKSRILLKATGDLIPLPALGGLDLPLLAQLQGNGQCWAASFFAERRRTPEVFLAESN